MWEYEDVEGEGWHFSPTRQGMTSKIVRMRKKRVNQISHLHTSRFQSRLDDLHETPEEASAVGSQYKSGESTQ